MQRPCNNHQAASNFKYRVHNNNNNIRLLKIDKPQLNTNCVVYYYINYAYPLLKISLLADDRHILDNIVQQNVEF